MHRCVTIGRNICDAEDDTGGRVARERVSHIGDRCGVRYRHGVASMEGAEAGAGLPEGAEL